MSSLRSRSSANRRPVAVEAQPGGRDDRHDGGLVVEGDAGLAGQQPDGAVHGAGVQIQVAEPLGHPPRDRALAGAGRPVDGDHGHSASTSARVLTS